MATLRDIKRRIEAVKNTKQITKAMKMVAAAKLRKAQTKMLEMRPYANKMHSTLTSLAAGAGIESHPLLTPRPRKTIEVIVMTSDRGLCGAYNSNILKTASRFLKDKKEEGFNVSLSVIGKKASDFFKRRDENIRKSWVGLSGNLSYSGVQEIAGDVIDSYLDETVDEVLLLYNEFKTVMTQEIRLSKLLPYAAAEEPEEKTEPSSTFIYEPSQEEIYNQLLPKNIEVQIFRALLESQASEEAARMTAMENATQNADEMIGSLTLQFNKARQASITAELMDIVGGVEALK
jgi:F-type H+-transporting ATPase subunit gamma